MTFKVLALSFLIAAGAGAAAAQSVGPDVYKLPPEERFAATDTNDDGTVSKDELLAVVQPEAREFIDMIWMMRDADDNGALTEAEFNASGGARRGRGAERVTPKMQQEALARARAAAAAGE